MNVALRMLKSLHACNTAGYSYNKETPARNILQTQISFSAKDIQSLSFGYFFFSEALAFLLKSSARCIQKSNCFLDFRASGLI